MNGSGDPELLKFKTKDDEIEELKVWTEKHDNEKNLKSLKIGIDYLRKNYKNSIGRKKRLIFSEKTFGMFSAKTSSTLSLLNPSVGIIAKSTSAVITSVATLIKNEYISKLKKQFSKL